MRSSIIVYSVAAFVAAMVTPALADDPPGTVQLNVGQPQATWTKTGSGVLGIQDAMDKAGCQMIIHDCGDQLIHVTGEEDEIGVLTVHTSSTDQKAVDTDLQIFESDATGARGSELDESAQPTPTPDESLTVEVLPGYYIARVDYALAVNGDVSSQATYEREIFEEE